MRTFTLPLLFLLTFTIQAQDAKDPKVLPTAKVFKSKQAVKIDGKTINLEAETGTVPLRDENDNPIALMGFTYYKKEGSTGNRPIMFAFNGGPLSASFWLHMGVLGPKRVEINDPSNTPSPYSIVNNEFSVLDKADLVMIDPVGVGFSKPIGESKWEDFWGVDQDIRSIALFIEQFLIRTENYNAPKYLLGESYGTFRNAGLVKHLQDKGITINGVIMVSAVFDLHHLLGGPGDDVTYLVHFPTYASTAWYHNKVKNKGENLESFLDEVRQFTENEYALALLKGDQLSKDEKAKIAQKLSDYTGLSQDYWLKANLRVRNGEYFQELMRNEGKTVGRLDSRFLGINEDLISQNSMTDPTSDAISAPFISAFKEYLYNDLQADKNMTYTTSSSSRPGFKWDWAHRGNVMWNAQVAITTLPDMATAMKKNPNLKILILNGYYDLATVFYGVEYSLNHMDLPEELKENIIMQYYEAGHMMYTHMPSMIKFKKDVDEFIDSTSK